MDLILDFIKGCIVHCRDESDDTSRRFNTGARPTMGGSLEHHPFSGQVHSAGELLHTHYRMRAVASCATYGQAGHTVVPVVPQ